VPDRVHVLYPGQAPPAVRPSAEEKSVDSSSVKVEGFLYEVIRFSNLDHRGQEAAFAVLALELTSASCEGNGRVAAALVLIPDHAWEIESNLGTVLCPGFMKSLLKEEFVLRSHWVRSRKHQSPGLTGWMQDKYLEAVQR
jgi:hypothetical protein